MLLCIGASILGAGVVFVLSAIFYAIAASIFSITNDSYQGLIILLAIVVGLIVPIVWLRHERKKYRRIITQLQFTNRVLRENWAQQFAVTQSKVEHEAAIEREFAVKREQEEAKAVEGVPLKAKSQAAVAVAKNNLGGDFGNSDEKKNFVDPRTANAAKHKPDAPSGVARMLHALIAINFKTTDGTTRYFKYGIFSKGIVVDSMQAAALKAHLRFVYLWVMLPMFVIMPLVGPIVMLLLFPAFAFWHYVSVNNILREQRLSDRIYLADFFGKLGPALPIWIIWTLLISSGFFVIVGVLVLDIGIVRGTDNLIDYLAILFFSFGLPTGKLLLDARNVNWAPETQAAGDPVRLLRS